MNLFEYNLNYVREGVTGLKNYLLSEALFWPIHLSAPTSHAPYPKLTIGNLLFYQKRTEACQPVSGADPQFSKLEDELQIIANKWRSAWEEKAEKEFRSRQRQWQIFLTEIRKGDASPAGNYKTEAKLRVLLALLSEEISVNTAVEFQLYDQALRSKFIAGEFLWEQEYSSAFPSGKYWYLYGKLK